MSYSENPGHGRPSTAPPKKRSRQIRVSLEGGPRDGDSVLYGQPLPRILAVSSKNGWTDYYRKPNTTTYIHEYDVAPEGKQT